MEEEIKVDIKIKNNGNLLANADLSLLTKDFGWVDIKDFQMWKSSNLNRRLDQYINIQPPSILIHGKYIPRVFFEDIEKWGRIESIIFYEYTKKLLETHTNNEVKNDDWLHED